MKYAERMAAEDSAIEPVEGSGTVFNVIPVADAVRIAKEADAALAQAQRERDALTAELEHERESHLSAMGMLLHATERAESAEAELAAIESLANAGYMVRFSERTKGCDDFVTVDRWNESTSEWEPVGDYASGVAALLAAKETP